MSGEGSPSTNDIINESDRVYTTIPVRCIGQIGQADRFLIIIPLSSFNTT